MSGGRRRDPKPTADITRSSGVWVVFGSVRSVEKVAKSCKRRQNLKKIRRNLQNPSRSTPKITEFSLDLLESRRISPNMVEISLRSPRMSPDLTKSRLDLLECRRISPNLTWIFSNIAGFVYNVGRVGWLRFWRRKPATRLAGVGSWVRKSVADHQSGQFGRFSVQVQAGCSSWSGSGLVGHP